MLRRDGDKLVADGRQLRFINMTTGNEHGSTGFTGACKSPMGLVDMSAGALGTHPKARGYQSVHYFGRTGRPHPERDPTEIEPIAPVHTLPCAQAKQLGLVDELGGLDAALADARALGKVDAAAEVEVYPPELTLHDLVGRIGEVSITMGAAPIALKGDIRIIPADDGTEVVIEGDLKASIPFLGGKVESAASPSVISGIHKEYAVGLAWLAERGHVDED